MNLRAELWLEKRLKQHGCQLFAGLTDTASRKAKARHAIQSNQIALVIVGRDKDGTARNYEQAFQRIYGEPLVVKDQHENGDGV